MSVLRAATVALQLAAAGCGPAAGIYLTADAPFVVPDQCDAVRVQVSRIANGDSLFDQTYPLGAAQPFPVTLTLVTNNRGDEDAQGVSVEVDALHSGAAAAPWASATGEVHLVDRQLVPFTVAICRPGPDAGCGP